MKSDLRALADQVRSIDLVSVLRALNCTPDPDDRKKWHTPAGPISVSGQKFMSWHQQTGGGGAIDLVMQVCDLTFVPAVRWLSEQFAIVNMPQGSPLITGHSSKNQFHARSILEMPFPNHAKLCQVLHYLIHIRKLPKQGLDDLIVSGNLYADARSNAVFVMRDFKGKISGAELCGTGAVPFKQLAKGSDKKESFFSCGTTLVTRIALCESAIDALSFCILHPTFRAVSTAGSSYAPNWLHRFVKSNFQVFCAFDADPAGDAMASALISRFPTIQRLRPTSKDWNEVLSR